MIQSVGIDNVHDESSEQFDNQELKDILFAAISEVLGLFPVRELVWFLTETKGKEVMNFLFILHHY